MFACVISLPSLAMIFAFFTIPPPQAANSMSGNIFMEESYVVPYPIGSRCKVLQGYNGPYGHKDRAEFAYDFQMPIGSPVAAARGGEVVKVVENNIDGTRVPGEENVVVIKHTDGTFGRYYHLTKDGALGCGRR